MKTRLDEHATQHDTSAVAQHFLQGQNAQHIATQTKTELTNKTLSDTRVAHMTNLIFNNYKILYTNNSLSKNRLLLMEALFIKSLKPELNKGLRASKELTLFDLT